MDPWVDPGDRKFVGAKIPWKILAFPGRNHQNDGFSMANVSLPECKWLVNWLYSTYKWPLILTSWDIQLYIPGSSKCVTLFASMRPPFGESKGHFEEAGIWGFPKMVVPSNHTF